jgi:hypothetical protein
MVDISLSGIDKGIFAMETQSIWPVRSENLHKLAYKLRHVWLSTHQSIPM